MANAKQRQMFANVLFDFAANICQHKWSASSIRKYSWRTHIRTKGYRLNHTTRNDFTKIFKFKSSLETCSPGASASLPNWNAPLFDTVTSTHTRITQELWLEGKMGCTKYQKKLNNSIEPNCFIMNNNEMILVSLGDPPVTMLNPTV